MIDFTKWERNPYKNYGGANGDKISIIDPQTSESYMLKFHPLAKKNPNMSYSNGCISEYLGCKIFESVGFDTQKTMLGTYRRNQQRVPEIVVACKDFEVEEMHLMHFTDLKNGCIESSNEGTGTELEPILLAIDEQNIIPHNDLRKHFWKMFIMDAFLGNFDRHNGNWGLLTNPQKRIAKIAPIYDCGSCLYPQMDEELMLKVLNNPSELNNRIYVFPNSALKVDGVKINYFDFLSSVANADCNQALKEIVPKINLEEINGIINQMDSITDLQKRFYKTILRKRKEKILDYSFLTLMDKYDS